MQVCTKCILPESYPHITFDDQGICNVCTHFDRRYKNIDYTQQHKELFRIIEKAKKKKREYDCMVPISGGRDSSMVLYLAVKDFKLKTLAFNYDNGFFSEQAKKNMEVLTKALDVDFISYRPQISKMMEAYRISFLKTGDFCIPCNRGVTTGIYKTAFDKKIPLILLGYCSKTDGIPREVEMFDQRLFKSVFQGEVPHSELRPFMFPQIKRLLIPRINVPDYFDWKEIENFKKLAGSFIESNYLGDVHFDCKVSPVADYIKRMKWGFGKKEMKLSVYIRDGQITREEASEKLTHAFEEPPELELWLQSLKVTRDDLKKAKDLSYKGYKSYNFKLLKFLRRHTKLVSFPYDEEID
jgi:N-acetyl sugar amidotransferase